jgi:hypothetical protein
MIRSVSLVRVKKKKKIKREELVRKKSITHKGQDLHGVRRGTNTARVERSLVKNVDALNLSEKLETLETRSLIYVRRHLAGLATRAEDGGLGSTGAADGGGGKRGAGDIGGRGARLERRAGSTRSGANDGGEHDSFTVSWGLDERANGKASVW